MNDPGMRQESDESLIPDGCRGPVRGRQRGAPGAMVTTRLSLMSAIVAAAMTPTWPVAAQCSANASSCLACHEIRGENPVLEDARPWHADHGFGDLCATCHAGDPTATAKEPAHVGLRQPLADPNMSCAGCHADDAAIRARLYRFIADSAATATAEESPTRPPSGPPGSSWADRRLVALAVVLALALALALRLRPAAAS